VSTTLVVIFGVAVPLTLVLTLFGHVRLVGSGQLMEQRRYVIVGAFIAAAMLTPPDLLGQLWLALPLLALYETSIWSVRLIESLR
jgi:sec-independent protein translocase protein TatC